jgi:hypothetical protein
MDDTKITKKCECGVDIFFGRSCGKNIPFEVKSTIFYLPANEFGKTIYGPVAGYVNHFTNCPLRDKFRKKKKEAING